MSYPSGQDGPLLYDWFGTQARWSESCVLIGYRSGRNGPILPAWDCPRWSRKKNFSFRPYNKSIIYKACSAFVYVFIDLDSVSINKNSKKELGQYPAILTSHLKYYIKSKIFSFLHVIDSATLCTLNVRVFSFSANVCSGPYFTSHDPCA